MKARRSSLDRISALPQPIIENILCRLSIEDVVRTSILSRYWRYAWIKIPELVFTESQFEVSTDDNPLSSLGRTFGVLSERRNMTKRCKFFYAIYQVLLLHQGPIDVFYLSMNADKSCVELDQIILHLSRSYNTLKKFTLCFWDTSGYRLPSSFFSLNQLTHLSLHGCHLCDQPMLKGFSSLTTLYLDHVDTSKKTLLHFLSSCPLIKRLTLLMHEHNIIGDYDDDDDDNDNDNDDDYGDNYYYDDHANIAELLDCLHVIEHLCISYWAIKCFDEDIHPQKLPPALVHLKFFCLVEICFEEEAFYGLPFVGLVIRSSPNLEKLRLEICLSEIESINLQDYSDIWLEHLKELEIEGFVNMKHELEFVKLILAKSPVLKKVSILLGYEVTKDEEIMVLRILLCSPSASPHVKIFVERPDRLTEV